MTRQPSRPLIPSSYIVRRYGGKTGNPNKQIVLTFDDGPDPTYTPQILDILKRYHVPAVFFHRRQAGGSEPEPGAPHVR